MIVVILAKIIVLVSIIVLTVGILVVIVVENKVLVVKESLTSRILKYRSFHFPFLYPLYNPNIIPERSTPYDVTVVSHEDQGFGVQALGLSGLRLQALELRLAV